MFFDLTVDPMVTCKTPGAGRDILQAQRQQPLRRRHDGRPRGVRGALSAQLARSSSATASSSKRSIASAASTTPRCRASSAHLEAALPFAPPSLGAALGGADPLVSDRRGRATATPSTSRGCSNRDSVGGHDERLHRGLHGRPRHQGRLGRRRLLRQPREDREDPAARRPTRSGSRITCRSSRRYRKPNVQGMSARAIEVVVEAGDSGPITPIGVNLPNDQRIRERDGSKSVIAVERDRGLREQSTLDSFRQEFSWDDAEIRAGASAGARLPAS